MPRKKGLTINKVRGYMYTTAKLLGDVQAIASGDPKKMAKRVGRRVVGKGTGRLLGWLFR